jgi:hypothetical protein
MPIVSIRNAKTHLSRLIRRVLAGKQVVIQRNAKPAVRMGRSKVVIYTPKKPLLGAMKGRMGDIGDEALAPLPEEYLGIGIRSDQLL